MPTKEIPITGKAKEKMPHLHCYHRTGVENRVSLVTLCDIGLSMKKRALKKTANINLDSPEASPCMQFRHCRQMYTKVLDTKYFKENLQFRKGPRGREIIDIKIPELNCRSCSKSSLDKLI